MNILYILNEVGLERYLKLMDHYGVSLVSLVIVGIFSWYLVKFILNIMKNQSNKIEELINKITKEEEPLTDDKIGKFAVNANKVQQLTYYLLNNFNADRISVYEFHNGGKTITGINFKKCSNTYEAVGLGIEEKYNEYQNIPISINFLWNKLLIDKKSILISNIDSLKMIDNTIYQILKAQGVKSYYSKLINDYNNKPIGFITIIFYKNNTQLTDRQLNFFNDISIKIGGLINKD